MTVARRFSYHFLKVQGSEGGVSRRLLTWFAISAQSFDCSSGCVRRNFKRFLFRVISSG